MSLTSRKGRPWPRHRRVTNRGGYRYHQRRRSSLSPVAIASCNPRTPPPVRRTNLASRHYLAPANGVGARIVIPNHASLIGQMFHDPTCFREIPDFSKKEHGGRRRTAEGGAGRRRRDSDGRGATGIGADQICRRRKRCGSLGPFRFVAHLRTQKWEWDSEKKHRAGTVYALMLYYSLCKLSNPSYTVRRTPPSVHPPAVILYFAQTVW